MSGAAISDTLQSTLFEKQRIRYLHTEKQKPPGPKAGPAVTGSKTVRNHFGVGIAPYCFICVTICAEMSPAVFFTIFSGAFFSITNLAAAT